MKKKLLELLKKHNAATKEENEYKKQTIDFIINNEIILGKANKDGHITGSSWIVSKDRKKVLLTHHNKLDKWFQLGGHTDENEDILDASLREAKEESGLDSLKCLSEGIFDVDVHMIPSYKGEKEHIHYDVRFLLEADSNELVKVSSESKDVEWINLESVESYSQSNSVLRMVDKTYKLLNIEKENVEK